jgi:hypothetical protein
MVATKQQNQISPIPPGRYWISVLGPENIRDFDQWIRDMVGGVRVEMSSLDKEAKPIRLFVIFNVPPGRAPFLNGALFGLPNFAPAEVQSSQDVEQAPIVLEPAEQISDFFGGLADTAAETAKAAAGGLGSAAGLGLLALAFLAFKK